MPFPETQWSLVDLAARGEGDERQRVALATLLQRYLPALRTHLVAARRIPADHIDDLLQGFVADELISRRLLERVRRERGSFRAFLLVTLNHYVVDQYRKEVAGSRRPANGLTALDDCNDSSEPVARGGDPAEAYALAWARELLCEALRRMKLECDQSNRDDVWLVFNSRVVRPSLGGEKPISYDDLVSRLGLAAPIEACNLLTTGKRMFARNLRAVAAEYADPENGGPDAELVQRGQIMSAIDTTK